MDRDMSLQTCKDQFMVRMNNVVSSGVITIPSDKEKAIKFLMGRDIIQDQVLTK